jgi:hypothetical protein
MGEVRNAYRILVRTSKEKGSFGKIGGIWRIALKWLLHLHLYFIYISNIQAPSHDK